MEMQRDLLTDRPFKNRMGLRAPDKRPLREVILDVCDRRGLTMAELISPRRNAVLVWARQEAMWECRRQTSASLPQIARALGREDHTTAIHGIRKHQERMGQTIG